jgi:hypothetical protein
MDELIHKRVLRISGSIPAVNYIKLPKGPKGLGATGRFLYLQVRRAAVNVSRHARTTCSG